MAWPPSSHIPVSNVTRVRSDGFSKIMARTLPASSGGRSPAFERRLRSTAVSSTKRTSSGERSSTDRKSRPLRVIVAPTAIHYSLLFRTPLPQYVLQIWLGDLLQFISYPDSRFADADHTPEIHRRPKHDDVTVGGRDGVLQFLGLLHPITHRRQHGAEMGKRGEHLANGTHRIRPWVDNLLDAILPCGDHTGPKRHPAVRNRRTVFDHQRAAAGQQGWIVHLHR